MMTHEHVLYGGKGTGSVAIEAALCLLDQPYRVVERRPGDDYPGGNPMGQVPVIQLPSGELMTESAAILIYLADAYPDANLAPGLEDPRRPAFLRWMVFIASQVYSLVWVRDDPSRLAADKAHESLILERTGARRAFCWSVMEREIKPGDYLLGDSISVLDLYVTVTSTWGPGRERFREVAPKMSEIIRKVESDRRLQALWSERLSQAR